MTTPSAGPFPPPADAPSSHSASGNAPRLPDGPPPPAQGEEERRPPSGQKRAERILLAGTIGLLLAAVFAHTFWLYGQGWRQEENAHGPAVPFLVAFILWMNWRALSRIPIRADARRLGLGALCVVLVLQVLGIWLGLDRTTGYLFIAALAALCLYFLGRRWTRALSFPLAFSLFMVPTPGGLLDMISSPLQILSARAAVMLAGLSGVGVQNEGVNLLIPARSIRFEVAVACSGLHSLTAMCLLAALLAYFMAVPLIWKWVMFALAVPLALLGNIARIYLVLMVANARGQDAGAAFHDGLVGKLLPFAVAFCILLLLGRLIERFTPRRSADAAPAS